MPFYYGTVQEEMQYCLNDDGRHVKHQEKDHESLQIEVIMHIIMQHGEVCTF